MWHAKLREEAEFLRAHARDRGNNYQKTKSMERKAVTRYRQADEAEAYIWRKVEYAIRARLWTDDQMMEQLGVTGEFVEQVRRRIPEP